MMFKEQNRKRQQAYQPIIQKWNNNYADCEIAVDNRKINKERYRNK